MKIFLSTKTFEFFIIILVILYTLIVFANFALDDESINEQIIESEHIGFILKIIELIILGLFSIEIFLKIYVQSFKVILKA